MQLEAPGVLDLSQETKATQKCYGLDNPVTAKYGMRCLMARRLVESGVRFVQVTTSPGQPWDHHRNIRQGMSKIAIETDQGTTALVKDLKDRGLLESTIVMWAGEFGRLPVAQTGKKPGRDHNPHCLTAWMAGGGIRGGTSYGASDDVGFRAAENRVHVNDLHATILHLLGLDHELLTYGYNGRDFRLTDVAGRVIPEIIA